MSKYKYRGYTYFATNNWIYTNVQRFQFTRSELRPVYHIEGLKDASEKPFLTSVRQCKDYIDLAISRMQKEGGEQQ